MSALAAGPPGAAASPGEFEVIERFFRRPVPAGSVVVLGIGDDCALLAPDADRQRAVTVDTLVEGLHFFADVDPCALGHKALAVSLSDLAACGAAPSCFFLALSLPRVDAVWLERFADGLFALADAHGCVLAGGDTTRSPAGVAITITAVGTVATGRALLRSGAQPGDDLWVSGELGDAALALAARRREAELSPDELRAVVARLERPEPRVDLGRRLGSIATSAIDVSDGLLGDLRHVLRASGVGATVKWAQVPRSDALRRQAPPLQLRCALAGGDDYELLFTAPPDLRAAVAAGGTVRVSRIGAITPTADLAVMDEEGGLIDTDAHGFDHFRSG